MKIRIESKVWDELIGVAVLLTISMITLLSSSLLAVLIYYGRLQSVSVTDMNSSIVFTFFLITFPEILSLVVIPLFWEVIVKKNLAVFDLLFPKNRLGRALFLLSLLFYAYTIVFHYISGGGSDSRHNSFFCSGFFGRILLSRIHSR